MCIARKAGQSRSSGQLNKTGCFLTIKVHQTEGAMDPLGLACSAGCTPQVGSHKGKMHSSEQESASAELAFVLGAKQLGKGIGLSRKREVG